MYTWQSLGFVHVERAGCSWVDGMVEMPLWLLLYNNMLYVFVVEIHTITAFVFAGKRM